jgi:GT2 family glycosyltransferase
LLSISIVIICYNSERFIENCIASLIAQTIQFNNIIVVDNNSEDSTKSICKKFKQVNLISLDYNSGYSKAANIGIDAVNSDLYLISNADTKYDKDFVKNTVSYFTDNKNVDLLSPLMLRFDKKTVDSAGQTYSLAFHPTEIGYNRKRKELILNAGKIFSVCGAASVFSNDALRRLKLGTEYYDEDFFMFWEDFDIGWRAHLMGMNTVFNPDSIVYHYRSGTLKKIYCQNLPSLWVGVQI